MSPERGFAYPENNTPVATNNVTCRSIISYKFRLPKVSPLLRRKGATGAFPPGRGWRDACNEALVVTGSYPMLNIAGSTINLCVFNTG